MPDPVIEARTLTVRRGNRTVLDAVDVSVARGEVTGLIGPNGVGKSTLMSVAGGLLAYQGGSVVAAGREVSDDPRAARRAVRAVFWPGPANHALTGAAYLRFLRAHWQAAWRPAMADWLTAALGMGAYLARPILTYSHGTTAKLAVIAALSFEAEAYLLDEALNGMDHRAVANLAPVLRGEAAAGRAVMVASHVVPVVHRLCDRVIVLSGAGPQAALPGGPQGGSEAAVEDALAALYEGA